MQILLQHLKTSLPWTKAYTEGHLKDFKDDPLRWNNSRIQTFFKKHILTQAGEEKFATAPRNRWRADLLLSHIVLPSQQHFLWEANEREERKVSGSFSQEWCRNAVIFTCYIPRTRYRPSPMLLLGAWALQSPFAPTHLPSQPPAIAQ